MTRLEWCAAHIPGFVDMQAKLRAEGDTRHLTGRQKDARVRMSAEHVKIIEEIRSVHNRVMGRSQ